VRVELDPDEKRMPLRYAGTCQVCGIALAPKADAIWNRSTKSVRCVAHDVSAEGDAALAEIVEAGTAGASARREFERRKANREQRIRTRHPKLGGFIMAVSDGKQSTKAWDVGALGEEVLGRRLNQLSSARIRLLHDRRVPGGKANMDHVAVTPTGIYVIDAKKYQGRPHLRIEGGVLRPRVERLLVGTRDCTRLVDGVNKQVDVVRGLLRDDVPVHGVLCFVDADWPLIGGAFATRGVQACWPKKLCQRLQAQGPLSVGSLTELHRELARALPPA
jgi:hypothetical protein